MHATNKDILEFFFDGRTRGVRRITRKDAKYSHYAGMFSGAEVFRGSKTASERGWFYGYVHGEGAEAFTALAFDERQTRLFNELRVGGKSFLFGEGVCQARFSDGKASVKDSGREVSWDYNGLEYAVCVSVPRGRGRLVFRYSFRRLPKIGNYRCVFNVFGRILCNWVLYPLAGSLEISAEGDVQSMNLPPEVAELVGARIEGAYAYTEAVRVALPMVSSGWNWNIALCQPASGKGNPKFVGLMQFFIDLSGRRVPVNFQVYWVDWKSGKFEIYGDATARASFNSRLPSARASSPDGKFKLKVRARLRPTKKVIKGAALLSGFGLPSADIDYAVFANEVSAVVGRRKYSGRGTSEISGLKKLAYWV
ncbi:MAG: hypothetical protein V1787_05550 [Candidatus Micrarchaeota archaeon]